MRQGATLDEVHASLPGDGFVAADLTATRAVTVDAAAVDVWPWLAQLGQGRAGFYSYDWLENLMGCDIHSADRIVGAWQGVHVGDQVRLHPKVSLAVAAVQPGRALVLRGGVPIGGAAAPYDFTWAFVLRDNPDGSTRLVVRECYGYSRWWARLLVEAVEPVSAVMSARMLRGIRDRAEQASSEPTRQQNEADGIPDGSPANGPYGQAGADMTQQLDDQLRTDAPAPDPTSGDRNTHHRPGPPVPRVLSGAGTGGVNGGAATRGIPASPRKPPQSTS